MVFGKKSKQQEQDFKPDTPSVYKKRCQEVNASAQQLAIALRSLSLTGEGFYDNTIHNKNMNEVNDVSRMTNSSEYKGDKLDNILFDGYKTIITNYLEQDYQDALKIIDEEALLEFIHQRYHKFALFAHVIKLQYKYLDNFYLVNTDLITTAFIIYRDNFWKKVESERLYKAIKYFLIDRLRNGYQIPKDAVVTIISMYAKIGFQKSKGGITVTQNYANRSKLDIESDFKDCKKYYEDKFEGQYTQTLFEHYQTKIAGWNELPVSEYVEIVNKMLDEEDNYNITYYPDSRTKINSYLHQILVVDQSSVLSNNEKSGARFMIDNKQEGKLHSLFLLYKRVADCQKCYETISVHLKQYIVDNGMKFIEQINLDKKKPKEDKTKKNLKDLSKQYIEDTIALKTEVNKLLEEVFEKESEFKKAIDSGFQSYLNKFEDSPLFLAQYSDQILRSTAKYNAQALELELVHIYEIFQYLFQRDEFLQKYQKFFGSRLLTATSLNDDAEKQIISKFKTEGANATKKLDKMIQDMIQSKQFMELNRDKINVISGCTFDIKVINCNWSFKNHPSDKINLPPQMKVFEEKFLTVYNQKYKNYITNFLFNQGTGEVSLKTRKRYRLQCSTYQLIILFHLYNTKETITFTQLQDRCGINAKEFEFNLVFLMKNKVISKKSQEKPSKDTDELSLNQKFENKSILVNVQPKGKVKEDKDDEKEAKQTAEDREKIKLQREYVIDANVVKVMKANREMVHQQLEAEVKRLTKLFQVNPRMVKARIESLIERNFLKRDDTNRAKYHYVP